MTDYKVSVFSETICELGEGIIYDDLTGLVFWVDIHRSVLYARPLPGQSTNQSKQDEEKNWPLDIKLTAVFSHNKESVLLAAEGNIYLFDLSSGEYKLHVRGVTLEEGVRCNDARKDFQGNIWFSSMSETAESGKGGIFKVSGNNVDTIKTGLTIPNAICFSHDMQVVSLCQLHRKENF